MNTQKTTDRQLARFENSRHSALAEFNECQLISRRRRNQSSTLIRTIDGSELIVVSFKKATAVLLLS